MASIKAVLAAYENKSELKKSARDLEKVIKDAQKKLAKVNEQLDLADQVDDVINGVPVSFRGEKTFFDMDTVANSTKKPRRSIHAYRHVQRGCWCVRVNEDGLYQQRFYGGRVLGLGESWTYDEAKEIAKKWITGDDSVLSFY